MDINGCPMPDPWSKDFRSEKKGKSLVDLDVLGHVGSIRMMNQIFISLFPVWFFMKRTWKVKFVERKGFQSSNLRNPFSIMLLIFTWFQFGLYPFPLQNKTNWLAFRFPQEWGLVEKWPVELGDACVFRMQSVAKWRIQRLVGIRNFLESNIPWWWWASFYVSAIPWWWR